MRIQRLFPILLVPAGLLFLMSYDTVGGSKVETKASGPSSDVRLPALLTSLSPAAAAGQAEQSGDRALDVFMQQKLNASTLILRGLMTDDLEMVEKNADKLLEMSRAEQWRASNDMMYLQHSTQFRNAVDDLRKKAARKSTDGASLAWVNVTMSCIQCHQWVRNVVLADGTP